MLADRVLERRVEGAREPADNPGQPPTAIRALPAVPGDSTARYRPDRRCAAGAVGAGDEGSDDAGGVPV